MPGSIIVSVPGCISEDHRMKRRSFFALLLGALGLKSVPKAEEICWLCKKPGHHPNVGTLVPIYQNWPVSMGDLTAWCPNFPVNWSVYRHLKPTG